MNMEFNQDFLKEMALLADAELRLQKISEQDNKIIEAYRSVTRGDSSYSWMPTQEPDEDPEEKLNRIQRSSELYRILFWLVHQHDVPGGVNPMIRGMMTVTEDKWSQSQKFSAWLQLRTKYATFLDLHQDYLHGHGLQWRKIPSPKMEKIIVKPGKEPIKEVFLDLRSNGFIVHFRWLPKDEHTKVRERISAIPGRAYFDGKRPGQRMEGEPHWYIPGDSISANALQQYLLRSEKEIQERADVRDYATASYWQRRLEQVKWDIKPGVLERIDWLVTRSKRLLAMSEAHNPSENFKLRHEYKNVKGETPRPFQIAGVEYILECTQESRDFDGLHGTGCYIGDPMGLGKSLECGIMAIVEAWEEKVERANDPHPADDIHKEDLKALILCPASLKKNWFREFQSWIGELSANLGYTFQIVRGNRAVRLDANFVIVNPELLRKEFNKETCDWEPLPLFTMLLSTRWFAILADEGHMYKTWRAQRTSNALELFSGKMWDTKKSMLVPFRLPVPMRMMMSGSPIMNRPAEWASQLEALGLLEQFGGQHRFEAQYCGRNTPADRLKELSIKLKERGYLRREKTPAAEDPSGRVIPIENVPKDVLDTMWVDYKDWPEILANKGYRFLPGVLGQLPPKIRTVVTLPLSAAWRKEYMQCERDFINWLAEHYKEYDDADKRVAAAMRAQTLVYIQKLKHLAAKGKVQPAIKWIKNFMAETEDQKLVYYVWHRDIHAKFTEAFPDAAFIIGGQDADVRDAMVQQFQTDPKCRLIICTTGAGGVGITLTAANHMGVMELPWNPAVLDQEEDRIWGRLNDLHGASIYLHLADYTIDLRIAAMIDRKRTIVTAATSGTDAPDESFIRELMDDFYNQYGRESPMDFEEIYKAATTEEDEDEPNGVE